MPTETVTEQLVKEQLVKCLTDVHSTEESALQMLHTGVDSVTESELKDLAQKGSAIVGGAITKMAPDTSGKVAIQAYDLQQLGLAA